MKKVLIAAALLSLTFALPALAAEGGQSTNGSKPTFEQRQSNILKMIDQRIARLQDAKTCVQSAKNDGDLKACREKRMSEMGGRRGAWRQEHEMPDCPGCGMRGPGNGNGGPMDQ
jgi:hypothetical protein